MRVVDATARRGPASGKMRVASPGHAHAPGRGIGAAPSGRWATRRHPRRPLHDEAVEPSHRHRTRLRREHLPRPYRARPWTGCRSVTLGVRVRADDGPDAPRLQSSQTSEALGTARPRVPTRRLGAPWSAATRSTTAVQPASPAAAPLAAAVSPCATQPRSTEAPGAWSSTAHRLGRDGASGAVTSTSGRGPPVAAEPPRSATRAVALRREPP